MSTPRASAFPDEARLATVLERYHDRIDDLFLDIARLVDDGDLDGAGRALGAFRALVESHIRVEEDLLFPLFDARLSAAGRPLAVMILEHRRIEGEIAEVADALAHGEVTRFRDGHHRLLTMMSTHMDKEERFLYPALDRTLGAKERAALLERIAAHR